MNSALIGHTGFVGSNLANQMNFNGLYNSGNIEEIYGKAFDLVVCAAAPGRKWYANENPVEDKVAISRLINAIRSIKAKRFVLISTVDVYAVPREVDENSIPTDEGLSLYGLHRLLLEDSVWNIFDEDLTILRLPGLFGPGLKKNVLFDLVNNRETDRIPCNSVYQWYSLGDLATDIRENSRRSLVNLVSEPIEIAAIQKEFFPNACLGPPSSDAPHYSVQSSWGRTSAPAILAKMARFLNDEPPVSEFPLSFPQRRT